MTALVGLLLACQPDAQQRREPVEAASAPPSGAAASAMAAGGAAPGAASALGATSARTVPSAQVARYLLTTHELGAAERALRRAVGGPVRVLEVRVYANRIVLQAQDPRVPTIVNQYVYQDGSTSQPRRVRLEGAGGLEDNLFNLDEVSLRDLPDVIEEGVRHVDAKHGRFDYALLRRALPHGREVQIRVYVKSPSRDGLVDADVKGRLLSRRH